ncbi:MAG: M48 family metallopeptidase [Cytophaga sp.]|nr:M48 family metallopeptidase [Undibacterium sp.]
MPASALAQEAHVASEITPHLLPARQRADLLPYSNEKILFLIMAIISAIGWVLLTVVTVGIVWLMMLLMYVIGLVAFSYFISYVRGNGVRVTAEQFPDLHARFETCCETVGMHKRPEFYLVTGNGALNAFATRFLHRYYVVLYSEIVDALEDDPDALNFYIGHELGHIAQKHLVHHWWLVFARWIPLLGSAYSRAREYTCDQFGLLCTNNKRSAVRALSVLAAGSRRWKSMNTQAYIAQVEQTSGFWMSLNELTADYPWLCKRVARLEQEPETQIPRRNFFAWLFAATVPNTGFGLIGALVVYVYLLVFLLPVAIAAYSSYGLKAKEAAVIIEQAATRDQLGKAYQVGMLAASLIDEKYVKEQVIARSVEQVGFKNAEPNLVKSVVFDPEAAELTLQFNPPLNDKVMKLSVQAEHKGVATWTCTVSGDIVSAALPESCSKFEDDTNEEVQKVSAPSIFDRLLKMIL